MNVDNVSDQNNDGLSSAESVSYREIEEAADRLEGIAHKTPVLSSRLINEYVGAEVYFKCENFQRVGAFKFRGGYNAISKLSDEHAARGVCTHSSGNHAQALALAAAMRGIPAYIVMPSNAPRVKKEAVLDYGAEVIECEPTLIDRERTAQVVIDETGASFIHPYNHRDVIAGQGTAARELILELSERGLSLDAMISPIGGGGLMSGTAISTKKLLPNARIWGVEPSGADDAARSLAAGHLIPQTQPNTICDGLLTSLGSLTWPVIERHVEQIFTVDDRQVVEALHLTMSRLKILIEPSCATPLAALLAMNLPTNVKRIGVILSGGNIDLERLADLCFNPSSPA